MTSRRAPFRVAVILAALGCVPALATAQTAENLLLVVNSNSSQSRQIADHYVQARQVPNRHVVEIPTADRESISRTDFETTIERPIAAWLGRHRLQDQVLYIVLTKGIPLRIEGTGGQSGTVASVDSELTLLYRKMIGSAPSVVGRIDNPYFIGERPATAADRFSRLTSDIYLVTRLDGFTVEDALKLVQRGRNPVREGQIVLDQKANPGDRGGDLWLAQAAERLTTMQQGARVQLETTRAIATSAGPVLGYFSWGSNDPANQRRGSGLTFASGAIGGTFVSSDGRTFREPASEWRPAVAGSTTGGQSMVGDLIREGLTGAAGHVAEPYLDAIVRPQILFPSYLSGFNLAESFYLSMPYLSWQTIVIGDPLCAPFRQALDRPDSLHQGIDLETDLPALFAARRIEAVKSLGLKVAGLKLSLKAYSLEAQGRPRPEIEALLVQATALEPRLTQAQFALALAAEVRQDVDGAIVRYRAILAEEPNNVLALNNLAYSLADRKNAAKEALPLAERAYRLSGQAASIGDTLGWVHFKLGNFAAALPYLERAARAEPGSIDILVHAASAHAGLNNLPQARTYLDAALKLDPKTASREDVKALAARIR